MAGKRSEGSTGRLVTDESWQRIIRLMDETFADYVTGLVALRKRVVDDMRRKTRLRASDRLAEMYPLVSGTISMSQPTPGSSSTRRSASASPSSAISNVSAITETVAPGAVGRDGVALPRCCDRSRG